MKTSPRVSIVIPAYNCERLIGETVASIQAQTFADWECVIIDDGSKDGTLQVIQKLAAADSRIRTATQPNAGPASARNNGFGMTDPTSDYVVFMDSDDIWFSEALQNMVEEIEKHPETMGVHVLGRCIDQDGNVFDDPAYQTNGQGRFICDAMGRVVKLADSEPTTFRSLWFSNPYPPGLIIAHRSAYEKVGPFDGSVCPMEDWDIIIRMCRHGNFRCLQKVLLSYRRHSNNLSGQSVLVNGKQLRNIQHKTFFSAENSPELRRAVRENWRASESMYFRQKWLNAGKLLREGNPRRAFWTVATSMMHILRWLRGQPSGEGPQPIQQNNSAVPAQSVVR